MTITQIVWISFLVLILLVIALDLGVFHRKPGIPSLAESLGWSSLWIPWRWYSTWACIFFTS